jgi:DNA-binding transcriptional regulator GbsR (MarR family)
MSVQTKSSSSTETATLLIDRIGAFIEYWGFRKVEGQIWALIYLSSRPLSGQEIAERLGFSKGMVSISIHKLIEFNVIKEVDRGAGRTIYYDSVEDLESTIVNVLKQRERKMMKEMKTLAQSLKSEASQNTLSEELSAPRVRSLSKLIDRGDQLLSLIVTSVDF